MNWCESPQELAKGNHYYYCILGINNVCTFRGQSRWGVKSVDKLSTDILFLSSWLATRCSIIRISDKRDLFSQGSSIKSSWRARNSRTGSSPSWVSLEHISTTQIEIIIVIAVYDHPSYLQLDSRLGSKRLSAVVLEDRLKNSWEQTRNRGRNIFPLLSSGLRPDLGGLSAPAGESVCQFFGKYPPELCLKIKIKCRATGAFG